MAICCGVNPQIEYHNEKEREEGEKACLRNEFVKKEKRTTLLTPLKEQRLRSGFKSWEMARMLGISETLYSEYETSSAKIPEEVQEKISQLFTELNNEEQNGRKSSY